MPQWPSRCQRKQKSAVLLMALVPHLHLRMLTTIIPNSQPNANVISLNQAKLKALCKQGHLKEALQILSSADTSTYVSLLQACIQRRSLAEGKRIHAHITVMGFVGDRFRRIRILSNMLVNMYAKCGSMEDARKVFDEMPERDVCAWTTTIAGYAKNGDAEEALKLFDKMKELGHWPNVFTFASVVSACARLVSLEKGEEIHEEIRRSGFECHVPVANALLDMYAKCGSIENARQMFDKMPERNVVSWTAMIAEGNPQSFCTIKQRLNLGAALCNSYSSRCC